MGFESIGVTRRKARTVSGGSDVLRGALRRLAEKTGFDLQPEHKLIGADESFRAWCERLGADGLEVDGRPFDLSRRPAMAWIYEQIPTTKQEGFRKTLVTMKCAQVGFTIMEILAAVYLGLKFGPATIGMFLPDMRLAGLKSSERFMPIIRSAPAVHEMMTQDAADGSGRKRGEGNVTLRRIGKALFVFSWTSGRATTESVPMDALCFDEVQEMTLEQMEKTRERLSASPLRFTLMGSTANWPDLDIHHWYKRGSQHRFHTRCPECGREDPLDDYFPQCIAWDEERGAHRYVCRDGHWIDDSQIGEWKPDNPAALLGTAPITSVHFHQMLSPDMSPDEIIYAFKNATDLKNFYNRKLGKPFLDPSQIPVTMEHLANCVEHGRQLGVGWKERASETFMGIDQMGQFNVVVIKERLPTGQQAVVHVEEVYDDDPFERCSVLMRKYGVRVCVVEINPNYNDAKRFANRHPGKVFICNSFGSIEEGMIQWGDGPRLDTSDRRTSEEARDRWTLRMDQYKCMQTSMARFTSDPPMCVFPDPQGLIQEVRDKGVPRVEPVLPRAFLHYTKTALVTEPVKDAGAKEATTNRVRRFVRKVGIDPHFSYANMLCDVAWSRAHGTSTFILPENAAVTERDERRRDAVAKNMPGMPDQVLRMIHDPLPAGERCGRCTAYTPEPDGSLAVYSQCAERNLRVMAKDPGCRLFVEAADLDEGA